MSSAERFIKLIKKVYQLMLMVFGLTIIVAGLLVHYLVNPNFSILNSEPDSYASLPKPDNMNRIENGIHLRTGLIEAEGLMTVVNNCTNCHSSKLDIQNRMNTERWNATIKWMQETQNLWELGKNQEVIVNYLVTNYPPKVIGRRANLSNIEWYELED